MASFDYDGAKKAGYSDSEIADYLGGQAKFNVDGARSAGFSDKEIIAKLRARNADLGEGIAQAAGNSWDSAKRLGSNLLDVVSSPLQTVDNLASVARGGLSGVLSSATDKDKAAWDSLKQMAAERYGSGQAIKETAITDPVGMAADLAGLLTGAGGALKLGGLAKAGQVASGIGAAIDPVSQAARLGTYPVRALGSLAAKGIEAAPEGLLASALKLPTATTPEDRASIIATARKERIPITQDGYDKSVGIRRNEINPAIGGLIDSGDAAGLGASPVPIARDALADLRDKAKSGGDPTGNLAKIQNAEDAFLATRAAQTPNGPVGFWMGLRDLQDAKTAMQGELKRAYKQQFDMNPMGTQAQEAIASGLRSTIENLVPDIAPLNKRASDLRALEESMIRAIGRDANTNTIPARSMFGGAAGGAAGGLLSWLMDALPAKSRMAFMADWARNNAIPSIRNANELARGATPYGTGLLRQLGVMGQDAWN